MLNKVPVLFYFLLLFYAILKEITEGKDWMPKNLNSKKNLTEELNNTLILSAYSLNFILWRRIFIITSLSLVLIFGIVFNKTPSYKEAILFFIILFTVIYVVLLWYKKEEVKNVHLNIKNSIKNIKNSIKNI